MEKELRGTLQELIELEEQAKRYVKFAPEGKLRCAINKGCYQYYIGKEYQGKKKRNLVEKIAQKEYNLQLLGCIKKQILALENLLVTLEKYRLDEVYAKLHPARKQLVKPYIKPLENMKEEFEKLEYKGKGFAEDDTTAYYTEKGERVRSKSEKIIADTLYRRGILYHYELPLELKYRNRIIVVYPDFTVLNKRTGKKYILEHLGMMDKMSYSENAMQKIDMYEKNGILLGDGLIITHETTGNPLDINVLERYIERFL
ncbi:MAG: hypothetical protein IJ397_09805 [Lachnospiraceae bacterium]|nr:hypothetical protein [Lachnospiraceae bacterium]